MQLNILGGSFKSRYVDVNNQRSINWYPVLSDQIEQNTNQMTMWPTPGLGSFVNITGRYGRGSITARTTKYTRCFVVVDQTLWEVTTNRTAINRGVMTNLAIGSSQCTLKVNGNQEVGIFGFTAGYVFNMDTNTLTQITDADYPGNVTFADYVDGFGFVNIGAGTLQGFVMFTDANSFLNWTGSHVYHPTFKAAGTIATVAFRDKVFNFSAETIEPYYEDGSSAVWSRFPGSILYTGALNAKVISVYDEGIIFLSNSNFGEAHVYLLTSELQNLTSISAKDSGVQSRINQNTDYLQEAYSFIQKTKDGHIIYYLTIPQLNTTFCYDVSTGEWYERKSLKPSTDSDGSQQFSVFRGINYCNFNGWNLFQDLYTGNLLFEDITSVTEVGTSIKRDRTSQTFIQEMKNISNECFELDATKGPGTLDPGQGNNPVIQLEVSIDGGHTYGQPRYMLLGQLGNYLYRARLQTLGTGRMWVLRLILTDPVDIVLINAWATGQVGTY